MCGCVCVNVEQLYLQKFSLDFNYLLIKLMGLFYESKRFKCFWIKPFFENDLWNKKLTKRTHVSCPKRHHDY